MRREIGIFLLAILIAGCVSTPEPTTVPLIIQRMATTPELETLITSWLRAYVAETGQVNLQLDSLSPQVVLASAESGEIEVIFIGQEPPQGWFVTPLIRDAIAVVVDPDLPVQSLEISELMEIFSGSVPSWEGFAEVDVAIQPIIPTPGDVFRERFDLVVMRGTPFSPSSLLGTSPEEILDLVKSTPGAIGFLPLEQVDAAVKVLAVEDVLPDDNSLRNGLYPLWIDVLAVAPQEPSGPLHTFLVWLQGTHFPNNENAIPISP